MNVSPRINTPDGAGAGTSSAAADSAGESARVVSDYDLLLEYLAASPVRDGDAWLRGLATQSPRLASRVAEVRLAYGSDEAECGFEWHSLRRVSEELLRDGNLAVTRDWAAGAVGQGDAGGA